MWVFSIVLNLWGVLSSLFFRDFLQVSKQNMMNSSGPANNNTFLGKIGNKFSFSDLAKIEVDFAEGFATDENISIHDQSEVRCDLDVLHQWILKA